MMTALLCLRAHKNSIPAFAKLDMRALPEIAAAMQRVVCAEHDRITVQGQPGNEFYVVEAGRFAAFVDGKAPKPTYIRGNYFGELALLRNEPRAATVRCTSHEGGTLWALDRQRFRDCVMSIHLRSVVARIPFLKHLDEATLELMSNAMFEVPCKPKQEVIKQGDFGDNFYLVESGSFKATRYNYHNEVKTKRDVQNLRVYNVGDSFGERALLQNVPR